MENEQKTTQRPPKSAEVARLLAFKKQNNIKWEELSEKIGVPKRTITNYVYETGQLSGAVLRGMLVEYGVSTDWLLTGVGSMNISDRNYADIKDVTDAGKNYSVNDLHSSYDVLSTGKLERNNQLLPFLATLDLGNLQDYFYLTAASIEQSLVQAGDNPGTDYTRLDLYKLAQPFVLEKFKAGEIDVAIFDDGNSGS